MKFNYIYFCFKKKKYSKINKFINEILNIKITRKDIKLLCNFIYKNTHMMLSYNMNKRLKQKKILYLKLLTCKYDFIVLSLLSAYTIYFYTIMTLLKNIYQMNNQIRINNLYDDKKIELYFNVIENTKLSDINYNIFLKKNININEARHNINKICRLLYKKLEID